jgi:hypothetical protein
MAWRALILSGVLGAVMLCGAGCESSSVVEQAGVLGDEERLPRAAVPVGGERVFTNSAGRSDRGLYYMADRDGRIYVVNESSGRVVFSGPIENEEKFWLNFSRERAMKDGRLVYEGNLRRGDRFQLYFAPR